MPENIQERLQKVLAHAGIASRRACETIIEQGRVTVNGQVAALGVRVDPRRDHITVDGQPLPKAAGELVYVILNKPAEVLSAASDHRGRKTVVDMIDLPERIYPVGRLDFDSVGLILLTNDGDLAQKLTHPQYHVEKEYQVLVRGRPTDYTLARWRRGEVEVEGSPTARAVVERLNEEGDDMWLKIILTEGRKRQIKVVAKTLGHPVIRLERVRFGPVKLGQLKPGRWRHLTVAEVQRLKAAVAKSGKSRPKR